MNRGGRALDLRLSDFGRPVDHLALQIRQRDRVVVDDAERTYPGGREIEQRRRAKSTGADHQHPRALERGLVRARRPRATRCGEHNAQALRDRA